MSFKTKTFKERSEEYELVMGSRDPGKYVAVIIEGKKKASKL
jgi:hypothetical protein